MKNEFEIEKAKERNCAEELENPENEKRWRERECIFLYSKELLEKELILDEITTLSEKLRK